MGTFRCTLFGAFSAQVGGTQLVGLGRGKVQELLCYVLLHRDRSITREALAGLLWEYTTTDQARAYLRRALWKLNNVMKVQTGRAGPPFVITRKDSIAWNPLCDVTVDVDEFEDAVKRCEGAEGSHLTSTQAGLLEFAVTLYEGDLLENYYQDWCIYKRERFRNLFLSALDKLSGYWQAQGQFSRAFTCTERILSHDNTREQAHRQLMLLKYLAGDRTGAIHQYERCATVLRNELGVAPAQPTTDLLEQIKERRLNGLAQGGPEETHPGNHLEMLAELKNGLAALTNAQDGMRRQVEALARKLDHLI
jgi:DNA-binding SARP family transcriptional activator